MTRKQNTGLIMTGVKRYKDLNCLFVGEHNGPCHRCDVERNDFHLEDAGKTGDKFQ